MNAIYKQLFNKIRYKLTRNLIISKKLISEYAALVISIIFLRPVSVLFCGGFLGVLFGLYSRTYQGMLLIISIYTFVASIIMITERSRKMIRSRLAMLLLSALFCGYCFSYIQIDIYRANDFFDRYIQGGVYDRTIEGNIVSLTESDENKEFSVYFLETDNHIKMSFYSTRKDLLYGQRVSISGSVKKHRPQSNPGAFDNAAYYKNKGIHLRLSTTDEKIKVLEGLRRTPGIFIQLLLASRNLRDNIEDSWSDLLKDEESAVLGGMLLGDKSQMSNSQLMWFRNSNLSHLIAVSGLHVSYFLIPISAGVRLIGRKRYARQAAVVFFLLFVGFLTGWSASVARAVLMVIISIICSFLGRRYDSIGGLFLSGLILLIISPYNAADIGFQLSFSATLFILVLSGRLEKILNNQFIPGIISGALACMICAQIGMMPILLTLSGKQSFILMAISIGGVFLSQGICLLSMPICMLRYCLSSITVFDSFFKIMFLPISGLLQFILRLSQFGSFESVGALRLQSMHPVLLIGLCGIITIFCLPKSFARKMLSKIFAIVILLGVSLNIAFFVNRPIATVIFTDVGQGDCALILCDQKCIIIDGGDVGKGINTIIPLLNYFGIRKIDIAIMTHPHSDHAGGLIELIEAEKIIQIGTPDVYSKENTNDSNTIFISHELLYQLDAGDNIEICDKVKLFVLSPCSDNLIEGEEGVNENSLVSLLTVGSTGILFMGDAGFQTEDYLLQDEKTADFILQNTDFLKVGHHGSKYSTSSEFLANMNVKAAVISVGPNYFGHPTDETLNRLGSENIDIYRTDLNGAVIIDIYEDETRLQTIIGRVNK